MKRMKMLVSLLLVVLMMGTAIPSMAEATSGDINFVYGLNSSWVTLMPYNHASSYSGVVWDALFEPLVCVQDRVVYRNAESIEISEDFTHWTIHLNPNVTWVDGTPTTAEDWVWTFQTVTNPAFGVYNDTVQMNIIAGTAASGLLEEGAELGVKLVDDYTFTIDMKSSVTLDTFASIRAGYWHALPKHLLGDMPIGEIGTSDFWLHPVGNGVCSFVEETVTGNELLLKARKDYYLGEPEFDYLTFKVVDSANVANALLNGELDTCYSSPRAEIREEIVGKNGLHAEDDPYSGTTYSMIINNRRYNAVERKAFDMMINKALIAQVIGGEGAKPAGDMYLSTMSYNLPYEHEFNPEKAHQMLVDEGFDFNRVIKFGVSDSAAMQNMGMIIQQNLAAGGVQVEIVTYEFSQLNAMQRSGEIDAIMQGNTVRYSATSHMDWYEISDGTYEHANDEELYALCVKADQCTDPELHTQLVQELQLMQWERCPRIYLYTMPAVMVDSARTSNVFTGTMTLLHEIHIAK